MTYLISTILSKLNELRYLSTLLDSCDPEFTKPRHHTILSSKNYEQGLIKIHISQSQLKFGNTFLLWITRQTSAVLFAQRWSSEQQGNLSCCAVIDFRRRRYPSRFAIQKSRERGTGRAGLVLTLPKICLFQALRWREQRNNCVPGSGEGIVREELLKCITWRPIVCSLAPHNLDAWKRLHKTLRTLLNALESTHFILKNSNITLLYHNEYPF